MERREVYVASARVKLNAKERKQLRELLLQRRSIILGDVHHMQDNALGKSGAASSGALSRMPYHMADVATDNFEHEFTLGLIENEEEELREIDEALDRLEKGDYGSCGSCAKPISMARLKIIPYARLCIACKREEESGRRG